MIGTTATVDSILASSYKKISWLFDVTDSNSNQYYWSTKSYTYNGQSYEYKVTGFNGITINRLRSELGIISSSDLSFSIDNKDNVITASDLENGTVVIRLVMSSGKYEEVVRTWKFVIQDAIGIYQEININCQDFIQQYLEGYYPNTNYISSIFPSDRYEDVDLCVPVVFGTCYIPLRPVVYNSSRYYLLGDGDKTFTISRVRSPREWSGKSEWLSTSYSFTQSTISDPVNGDVWKVFQPIIAKDRDGVLNSNGVWCVSNQYCYDMPTQFSDSDTLGITNPADVINYVIKDFGISSSYINDTTFSASTSTFSGWGLEFNGAFYYKQERSKVLSTLLNQAHATLYNNEQIELHILSSISQKTITSADVIKNSDVGKGTFLASNITQDQSDSGYIAFQESGESQDEFVKYLVPAKSSTDNISSEILEIPFVQDSENAQKIGSLYYQRRLLEESNRSFVGKAKLAALQPDDVITISEDNYGGSYNVLIDSMTFNKDASIQFNCIKFKEALDDWEDLSFGAATIATESTTNYWSPVICGPDSTLTGNDIPNLLRGRLRIGTSGNNILIDPSTETISSGNYISGAMGSGFSLSPELLEVGNISARGMIKTSVFEKSSISAIGGNFLVRPADVLDVTMGAADSVHIITKGSESFATDDILRIKNGLDDEWFKVTATNGTDYTVTRDMAGDYSANTNPAWTKGSAIVNYGQADDGGIFMTSSESNAPYISVFTINSTPWDGLTTMARLGNLNGYLGYTSDIYGIGIGDSDAYLKYDPTDGMRIKGTITVGSFAALPSDEHLVGYWAFDDGSGTVAVDSSGNGNHGTLTNMTDADWVDGVAGKCLDFDGTDDYVEIDDDSVLDITGAMSFSLWFKAHTLTSNAILLSKGKIGGATPYCNYSAWYYVTTNKLIFEYAYGATRDATIRVDMPTDGEWHHVVFTWDGTTDADGITVYLDTVATHYTASGTFVANNEALWIGGGKVYFDGLIDEVRIYDTALTESEVKALYLYPAGSGQTRISGNQITTGIIQSTNWAADAGSQINLDDGKFYLGGSTSPKLSWDGTDLAIDGTITVGSFAALPSDEHLVGYWAFDDGSGTVAVDSSGNGNHGTLTNMTDADWVDGVAGKCLDFDGTDDFVEIDNPVLGKTAMSISCWVKKTAYTQYQGIVADYGTQKNFILGYETPENTIRLYVGDGTNADSISATGFTQDVWHHIAAVFDGDSNELSLYVDCVKSTKSTAIANIGATEENCRIGTYSSYEFNGLIDEVRIYDTALTESEVKALYLYPAGSGQTRISGNQITTGVIQSTNWATDAGMQIDLDNATFTVREADGLQIDSGAGIKVVEGGDIYLVAGPGDGGKISFSNATQNVGFRLLADSSGSALLLATHGWAEDWGEKAAFIEYIGSGSDATPSGLGGMKLIRAYTDSAEEYAELKIDSDGSGDSSFIFTIESEGTTYELYIDTSDGRLQVYPGSDGGCDLGVSNSFNEVYAKKFYSSSGVYIGGVTPNSQIDDSSNGSGSTTLYIGNKSITTAFTACHYYQLGDLDLKTGESVKLVDRKLYRTNTQKDPSTIGIFWGITNFKDSFGVELVKEREELVDGERKKNTDIVKLDNKTKAKKQDFAYAVACIGDSYEEHTETPLTGAWVTVDNGKIETGDYLCSSSRAGYLEKQDDDIIHNYTVGKAMQSITEDTKTAYIYLIN